MELRDHKALWGISTSILQFFTFFLIQIILTPLILKYSGSETLAAYSIFMQFIGYSILFDLGISTTLIRYLSQSYYESEKKFINFFSSGRIIILLINIFFVFILLFFSLFPEKFLPLSEFSDISEIQKSFFLLFLWFLIKSFFLPFSIGLTATQNLKPLNLIILFSNIFRFILSLFFILNDKGLYELVLAFTLSEFLNYLIQFCYFKIKVIKAKIPFLYFNFNILKELFSFGFIYWLINLSVLLFLNSDLIFLGMHNSSIDISNYYLTKLPIFILMQIIFRIADNYLPALNELYNKKEFEKFNSTFLFIFNLSILSSIFIIICAYNYNFHILKFWVGSEYFLGNFITLCFSFFAVTQILNHLNAYILITAKKLKYWGIFSVITSIIGFPLLYYVSKNYEIEYMALALVIIDLPYLLFTTISVLVLMRLKLKLNYVFFFFPAFFLIFYINFDDYIFDYNSIFNLIISMLIVIGYYIYLVNNLIYKHTQTNILWIIRKKFQF